jgi:hypothetical protein
VSAVFLKKNYLVIKFLLIYYEFQSEWRKDFLSRRFSSFDMMQPTTVPPRCDHTTETRPRHRARTRPIM